MGSGGIDQSLDDETFPARSSDRMAEELIERGDVEQTMDQPGIAHIDLGRADKPLAQIAAPRLQPANEQQIDEHVDIAPDHGRSDRQSLRQTGGIEQTPLPVRQHRPEPTDGCGRHPRRKHRHIALEV